MPADPVRDIPEAAGLHYRVIGFSVQIRHRRVHPVDPYATCVGCRNRAAPAREVQIVEEPEGRWRRQVGESFELLPAAALEVRRYQERVCTRRLDFLRESARGIRLASKQDVATDA